MDFKNYVKKISSKKLDDAKKTGKKGRKKSIVGKFLKVSDNSGKKLNK